MPRVPTYSNLRVAPGGGGAGRVSARGSQVLGGVQGDQLREVGQSVQQVGGALHAEVERQQDRINRARVQEVALSYREELSEAEREYQQFKGAELVAGDKPIIRDIEARVEQSRSKMMQSLSSPAAQRAFGEISMDMAGTWRQRAAGYEAEQAEFYIGQQRDGAIVAQVETGIADPDKRATSFQSASSLLREKFEDQGYDGDALNQKTQEAMGQLLSGQIAVLVDAGNTQSAREVLGAGSGYLADGSASQIGTSIKNKEMESFALAITEGRLDDQAINEMHREGQIDDGDKLRLTGQYKRYEAGLEAQRKAQETERQKVNFERLRVAIDDGIMGRADADEALDSGSINITQWSQAARLANDAASRQTASASVASALELGLPLDPRDSATKKGVNELFGGKGVFAEDFQAGLQRTAEFAQFGIIPSDAQSVLSGFVSSGTPDQQRAGLMAIGDLYAVAPDAVDAAFNGRQLSDAISYTHKVNAGVDENAAYEALMVEREARDNPGSAHQALIAKARKLSGDFTIDDALKRRDADGERGIGPFWNDGPKVGSDAKAKHVEDPVAEAQIVQDFQSSFEVYYAMHGDEALAKRQAAAVMGKTIGRSEANGGRAMMHPPEKIYGIGGDWAKKALDDMFAGRDGGVSDVQLVSDQRTARDVRDGRAPTYGVVIYNKNGVMEPLQARVDFQDEYAAEVERLRSDVMTIDSADLARRKLDFLDLETKARGRGVGTESPANPFSPHQLAAAGRSQDRTDVDARRASARAGEY